MWAAAGGAPLDVGSLLPELAVDGDEAGRLEPRRRGEDVEPERRLDHELLRVGAAQDRLGRVHARVQHVPHPIRRDGEEMLPGTVPAAEEKGGDDKEAGHRLALRVALLGGRVKIFAYSFVGLVGVRGRLVVEDELVLLPRRGISPSKGLLVQRSEQAHSIAHGRILLDCPNNKLGYRRVRQ